MRSVAQWNVRGWQFLLYRHWLGFSWNHQVRQVWPEPVRFVCHGYTLGPLRVFGRVDPMTIGEWRAGLGAGRRE